MTRAIGSDFHLPPGLLTARKKKNLPTDRTFLASGRACLKVIITAEELAGKTVLLPAYLCDSVLLPFKEKKVKMVFYRVNHQLIIDQKDLFEKIKKEKPDAVVIIHYFGWIQPRVETIIKRMRKQSPNCVVIEDLVQSYLTSYQPRGDYWFNSYRKFLPVADGAFVTGKKKVGEPAESAASGVRLMAMLLKNMPGMKSLARRLFQTYEHRGVNRGISSMSWFSRYIIKRVDENAVKNIRRKNYQHLARLLTKEAGKETDIPVLFPKLPEGVCPLGLPVIVKDRDAVRRRLIQQKIYCPVHWDLPTDISKKKFPVSHVVSEHIFTIPIDQRYTKEDMERIARCLKKIKQI